MTVSKISYGGRRTRMVSPRLIDLDGLGALAVDFNATGIDGVNGDLAGFIESGGP